eukprot:SAG22_NODE_505_length_9680_cov_10.482831_13_plen_250_part_00
MGRVSQHGQPSPPRRAEPPPPAAWQQPPSPPPPPHGRVEATGDGLSANEREELTYLRRLRGVHAAQIQAMGESNATLQMLVQKLEDKLDRTVGRCRELEQAASAAPAAEGDGGGGGGGGVGGRAAPASRRESRVLAAERQALEHRLQQAQHDGQSLAERLEAAEDELDAATLARRELEAANTAVRQPAACRTEAAGCTAFAVTPQWCRLTRSAVPLRLSLTHASSLSRAPSLSLALCLPAGPAANLPRS